MKPNIYKKGSDPGSDSRSLLSSVTLTSDSMLPLYNDGVCDVRTGDGGGSDLSSLILILFLICMTVMLLNLGPCYTLPSPNPGILGKVCRHFQLSSF